MTNDTTFGVKKNSTPSIMEPIDETPSLTLTVGCALAIEIIEIQFQCGRSVSIQSDLGVNNIQTNFS